MRGGGQDNPGFHLEDDGVCVLNSALRDDAFHTRTAGVPPFSQIPTGKWSSEPPLPEEMGRKPFFQPDEGQLSSSVRQPRGTAALFWGDGEDYSWGPLF